MARSREAPEEMKRKQLEENPSWTEEDAVNEVASSQECDAGPIAQMMREDLHYDLSALIRSIETPSLLILASEQKGSALPNPERTAAINSLRKGTAEAFDTSHLVHREDFEGYVRLLGEWLEESGH